MQQPQRDNGGVIPYDAQDISLDDWLIRYIPSVHVSYQSGLPTLSSAAFSHSTPPDDPRSSVSVDIERLLPSEHAAMPYRAKSTDGVAKLEVVKVRSLGLKVGWDPLPKNAAHGAIWGVGKSKSIRRRLRDGALLVVCPPQ